MRQTQSARRRRPHSLPRATAGAGLVATLVATLGTTSAASPPVHAGPPPVTWPTHCLDAVPTGPADYQAAFDYRQGGWAGADGALPIALPDGRALWLFGDTWIGDVDENNALLPGARLMISAQVQDGACFTPLTGGTVDEPSSLFPNQDGLLHWAGGGFVDTSVNPPVVRVVATGVRPGTLGEPHANRTFTLSLPKLKLISIDDMPYEIAVGNPSLAGTVARDGDTIYLLTVAGPIDPQNPLPGQVEEPGLYVARAPADDFINGTYEYWTGDAWSPDIGEAGPVSVDFPGNPVDQATPGTILPWGDGYLMTGKAGHLWVFDTPVYAWTADTPTGPWSVVRDANGDPVDIAASHPGFPQGRWIYGGYLVTNVPGTSIQDPMLVFSTNGGGCNPAADPPVECTPDNDVRLNVYLYGPHFLSPSGLPSP